MIQHRPFQILMSSQEQEHTDGGCVFNVEMWQGLKAQTWVEREKIEKKTNTPRQKDLGVLIVRIKKFKTRIGGRCVFKVKKWQQLKARTWGEEKNRQGGQFPSPFLLLLEERKTWGEEEDKPGEQFPPPALLQLCSVGPSCPLDKKYIFQYVIWYIWYMNCIPTLPWI